MKKEDQIIFDEIKKETEDFNNHMNKEIIEYYLLGGRRPINRMYEIDSICVACLSFNNSIYEELTTGGANDLFDPINFFDELYRSHERYLYFINKPGNWDAYFRGLKLSLEQKNYLKSTLEVVKEIFKGTNSVTDGSTNETKQLIDTDTPSNLTRSELMKEKLNKYKFFDIDKVTCLPDANNLVSLLAENDTPYQIAMFDYLGFINYITKNFTKQTSPVESRNKIISEIIDISFDTVKNNINYLDKIDSKKRYKSSLYKETVINDYKALT